MELEEAKQTITEGDKTLDALADALLQRVAQFMGECVQADSFCGVATEVKRDQNGSIQCLMLIPCDDVNGDPVRRYESELPRVVVQ